MEATNQLSEATLVISKGKSLLSACRCVSNGFYITVSIYIILELRRPR
jgi:hypothetical protein